MIKITKTDYEFLFKLNSLSLALGTSATSSVVIPSSVITPFDGSEKIGTFSHIYYDAEDNGLEIMKKRILRYEDDIRQHYKYHRSFSLTLSAIEDASKNKNRADIGEGTAYLCKDVSDYIKLVKYHEDKAGEESFLSFPTSIKGHYFYIPNTEVMDAPYKGVISEIEFNSKQNEEYARRDLLCLEKSVTDFIAQKEEFNLNSVYNPELRDYGINSVSKKLDTVKLLLERAGLELLV